MKFARFMLLTLPLRLLPIVLSLAFFAMFIRAMYQAGFIPEWFVELLAALLSGDPATLSFVATAAVMLLLMFLGIGLFLLPFFLPALTRKSEK